LPVLGEFCRWVNEEVGGNGPLPELDHGGYGERVAGSLNRHFAEDRQKGGLRISSMGKPAVLQALAKLGYTELEPKGKMRWTFHLGDIYEHFAGLMLETYGYTVLCDQMDPEATLVKYEGVSGHYDFLVKTPEHPVLLVEVKTMGPGYARKFRKTPNDARGYITQLAMYQAALSEQYGQVVPAVWLCLDKGTGETFYVEPFPGLFQGALARVSTVVPLLGRVKSEDDILAPKGLFQAPPAQAEVYRRKQTGHFILPENMIYSPFASAFYDLEPGLNGYGSPQRYVVGMKGPDSMKKELARLVDSGEVIKNA
jgi:hypothetical protein